MHLNRSKNFSLATRLCKVISNVRHGKKCVHNLDAFDISTLLLSNDWLAEEVNRGRRIKLQSFDVCAFVWCIVSCVCVCVNGKSSGQFSQLRWILIFGTLSRTIFSFKWNWFSLYGRLRAQTQTQLHARGRTHTHPSYGLCDLCCCIFSDEFG